MGALEVRLSFSIGPVQSFVVQSRRTRDLWASSWLLSRLSSKAMSAALKIADQAASSFTITALKSSALDGSPHSFDFSPSR